MPISLKRVDVFAYRVPITTPVATSFGVMSNRPAVFVRIEDSDGAFGFGEIFANWPAAGAEHRARLLVEDIGELLFELDLQHPGDLLAELTTRTHIRTLQCGEWGPFRQVIAGLDTAYIDLLARRVGLPVAQFLNPNATSIVRCYASGIAISQAHDLIEDSRQRGVSAFKVKVGFDLEKDIRALSELTRTLQPSETVFADANQAWDLQTALAFADQTKDIPLGWLEEPLPADARTTDWKALAEQNPHPIAAGENIAGFSGFDEAIRSSVFDVLQPDVAKWGGISGCWAVGTAVKDAGLRYCPHFLGGGIGLMASAHVLAAVGGDGLLEVDVNPNPLRDAFDLWHNSPNLGQLHLAQKPGLGIDALPEEIDQYRTFHNTITA